MKEVYSYSRISSTRQREGHGLERQAKLAQEYAKEHGLLLLELNDSGISAFKADDNNATKGKLAWFLQQIKIGEVKPGSVLLVEALDRLSRDHILSALEVFIKILKAGVEIHTLADNKVYTAESHMNDIMFSFILMSQANQESVTKSRRQKANWVKAREELRDGNARAMCNIPKYIKRVGDEFVIPAENKAVLLRIVDMYLGQGLGARKIAGLLNEEGVPSLSGHAVWNDLYITRILRNEALIGNYKSKGVDEPIIGIFPPVVELDVFNRLQNELSKRCKLNTPGRSDKHVNVFKGLLKCGDCQGSVKIQSCSGNKRYYRCAAMIDKSWDCCNGSWRQQDFEHAFFKYVGGLDLYEVFGDKSVVRKAKHKVDALEGELLQLQGKVDAVADLIEETPSPTLMKRLTAMEVNLVNLEEALRDAKVELARTKPVEADGSLKYNISGMLNPDKRRVWAHLRRLIKCIYIKSQKGIRGMDGSAFTVVWEGSVFRHTVFFAKDLASPGEYIVTDALHRAESVDALPGVDLDDYFQDNSRPIEDADFTVKDGVVTEGAYENR